MKRTTASGSIAGLLLCSIFLRAQQKRICPPIPPGQPAALCMSNANSPPIYPPAAKAAGIQGTVKVFAQINKSGTIDLLWVVSGPEPLREAALRSVNNWIYRSVLVDGKPAGFRTVINVNFTLEK